MDQASTTALRDSAGVTPIAEIARNVSQTFEQMLERNMSNTTANSTLKQPIFRVLVTAEAIFGFYLLLAVVYSEWKLRNATLSSSQMHAKRLRRCCLFAMTVGTIHLLINEYAVLAPPTPKSCTMRLAIQKVSYTAGMFAVYVFLWLRQKLFYSNPSLRYLYSKRLRYTSWTVLVIILLCFVCQVTMTVLGVVGLRSEQENRVSASTPCINPQERLWIIQISLAALSSFLVHISLMGLFLFPLCKHSLESSSFFVRRSNGSMVSRSSVYYRTASRADDDSLTASPSWGTRRSFLTTNNNNEGRPSLDVKRLSTIREQQTLKHKQKVVAASDRLKSLIIRCLTLTAICVLASISVTILTVTLYHGGLLATFLYGSNMLTNMACCTGCFSHWPSTLLPFCIKPKKRKIERTKKQSPSEQSQRLVGKRYDSVI